MISNLGEGQHGHLPDAEYNRITGYTNTKPSHPGDLKIAENTQVHKAIIMRNLHNKKLNLFCETAAVESAIKSQILAAIEPIYLKELKNRTTETIEHAISQILTHLFQQYGQVLYHQIHEEKKKCKIFVYALC